MLNLTENEKEVLKKIITESMEDCGILRGCSDRKNGNRLFMYGVTTVMEYFAYSVDENFGDTVSQIIDKNMYKPLDK
jgi:hypothetical protein